MGYISNILRKSKPEETIEGEVSASRSSVPREVAELMDRKRRALGDKIPKPGTPEAVIEARFDKQIREALERHGKAENQ